MKSPNSLKFPERTATNIIICSSWTPLSVREEFQNGFFFGLDDKGDEASAVQQY